jgi:hypothetical protein
MSTGSQLNVADLVMAPLFGALKYVDPIRILAKERCPSLPVDNIDISFNWPDFLIVKSSLQGIPENASFF